MRTDCLNCGRNVLHLVSHITEGGNEDAKFCNEVCAHDFDLLDEREQELRRKPEYILRYIALMLWCGERERAELRRRRYADQTAAT